MLTKTALIKIVKNALIFDKYQVISESPKLYFDNLQTSVDFMVKKETSKIAVDVVTLSSNFGLEDLTKLLGSFLVKDAIFLQSKSDTTLYFAVSKTDFAKLTNNSFVSALLDRYGIYFLVIDEQEQTIFEWVMPIPF